MDVDESHGDVQNDPGISSYNKVPDTHDGSVIRSRNGAVVQPNDSPPGDPIGAWSKGFRRVCRYLLSKNKSDVLVLLEPQVSGTKAHEVCDSLGFSDNVRIEATGAAGGIWVLWNSSSTDLQVILENQNFIHVKVKCARNDVHFFFVYGPPTPARRSIFWRDIEAAITRIFAPLFVGGDFNCILRMEERWGGSGGLSQDSPTFADLVDRLDLIDLGFSGSRFTWRRGPSEAPTVAKRLDRFFTNVVGRIGWEEAVVRHLPAIRSDHNPLFLCLDPSTSTNRGHRPFRFEAMWLAHPQFMSFLLKKWKRKKSAPDALGCLQEELRIWNKEVFKNLYYKKEKLLRRIEGIDNAVVSGAPPRLFRLQSKLKRELEDCLQQEELFWFQKSREKWVELGDRNTAYFHASTIIRRRRKYVLALKDHAENWVVVKSELEELSLPPDASRMNLPRGGFPSIHSTDLLRLGEPITDEEIRAAFYKMGAYKAPGIDRFQPVFYQKCWNVVRESVCTFIRDFFSTGCLPPEANETLIHLIGKVDSPELVSQFRPISLCNVLYKAITKILSNRLRPIMEYVVSPMQSSFIPGRFIMDNVLLAQELVHSMKRKTGRKGWFLLKLDLEKAYDRLRWDFIEDTLRDVGLPDSWVRWIIECVSSASMRVLWNGEITEKFTPSRWVRQGDSISPYLFVLCLERLSHLISTEVASGNWRPIRVCRGAPRISHVFFADDIILAAEASVGQMRVIMRVLDRFCQASGQKISLAKSTIFVSKNVDREMTRHLESVSGIRATTDLGKYLRMSILHGKVTKATFSELIVKANKRLTGWKSQTLSMAGRVTLAKSVMSAIPSYAMNSVQLLSGTCEDLDKIIRSFIWGSYGGVRKPHLVDWGTVCSPKSVGGLGVRSTVEMNMASLGKLGWRLINEAADIWGRIMTAKYGLSIEGGCVNQTKLLSNMSYGWRSIRWALEGCVGRGIRWNVGDGSKIRFWLDHWLDGGPLINLVVSMPPVDMLSARICDFWELDGGWVWGQFSNYLPASCLMRLCAVVIRRGPNFADSIGWAHSRDGEYSTKSAYLSLKPLPSMETELCDIFRRIWRLRVSERIRMFLWIGVHGKLMTNAERFRRHFASSPTCSICGRGDETLLHIFRDCDKARDVWNILVDNRIMSDLHFFDKSAKEWLLSGIRGEFEILPLIPNEVVFAVVLWWLWRWRNGRVFKSDKSISDIRSFVLEQAKEFAARMNWRHVDAMVGRHEEIHISWSRPAVGWVKVNTDGARESRWGMATAGGVIRNDEGRWMGGFVKNIGVCSVPCAELWGIFHRLELAWESGCKLVVVESDSSTAIAFMNRRVSVHHPLSSLVLACQSFISRDWVVQFRHCYREANRVADHLASLAFDFPAGCHVFSSPIASVISLLSDDDRGVSLSRLVQTL
ncbi:hypothetical protein V2J09_001323 [Rumex salicifolius]